MPRKAVMRRSTNGWTGGQYSVWRAAFGAWLAVRAAQELAGAFSVAEAVAFAAAVLFAIGWRDRVWAAVLAATILGQALASAPAELPPEIWLALPLLVHVVLPRAPYGSWDARARVDPRGGWSFPVPIQRAARIASVLVLSAALLGFASPLDAIWLLFLAADPGWIAPRSTACPQHLFYDGHCGLCHRFVRFVLAEDRRGTGFRFAPLQGPTFERIVPAERRAGLPDSIVLVETDGGVRVRSAATLRVLAGLGGMWRVLAWVLSVVPRPLRDAAYDGIAAVRLKLFARPAEVCPVLPADLRERFDP